MKCFIVVAISVLGWLAAFGEGTVNFVNIGNGWAAPVYLGFPDSIRLSGPQYRAGLFAGPSPGHLSLLASTPFLTGGGAGFFSGGTVEIPGVQGGGTAWVQVVAWDTTLFGTTDDASFFDALAYNPGMGFVPWAASSMFSVVTGNPASFPPTSPAPLTELTNSPVRFCLSPCFRGFTVQPTNQTLLAGATATLCVQAIASFPACQWYFNGAPIPGANGSCYQIANVQPTNSGSYNAVLSGRYYVQSSDAVTLTVLSPPFITRQPQTQTAFVGSTVRFSLGASGNQPVTYQWFFNGTHALDSGTEWALRLTNVQAAQIGAYTAVAKNAFGTVTSSPAMLNVIPPVPRRMVPALSLLGQAGSLLNLENAAVLAPSPNWASFDNVALTNTSQGYFDLSIV